MKINDKKINKRVVSATLNEDEIKDIIASHIAGLAGIDLCDERVKVTMLHITSTTKGCGYKHSAVCEITQDLEEDFALSNRVR